MRVLISGAGIGGLTLAYWLHKTGHIPVVIEKAPNIRTDGYMIDFIGSSWDVANRMGLTPQLEAAKHNIEEMVFKDAAGKTIACMPVEKLFHALRITDRSMTLDRRDLVEILYHAIQSNVEVHFSTSLTTICQFAQGVEVTARGSQLDGTFDLVVGADGIHSNVRQLIFGSENQYADYLGYYVAAFYTSPIKGSLETRCAVHVEPGVQFGIYPLSDGRWLVISIYKSANEGHIPNDQRLSVLRSHLCNVGWITQQVLDALPPDTPIFMDTVTQIKMPQWSSSRVVMLGDAAYCPTLISGQGAGLAMAGAYFLAEELIQTKDVQMVLARYEKRLRPYVEKVQTKARRFAPNFVPDSQLRMAMFNWAIRFIDLPPITHLFGKQLSLDSIIPASSAL